MPDNGRHGYTVTYDSDSHWKVLTQMWGSIWPKVLPYCMFNVAMAATIEYLDSNTKYDLAISDKGHTFMNLMVSFLIVSRVTISLGRYNESRSYLGSMFSAARELVQDVVVQSAHNQNEKSKIWRNEVAYKTCLMLRCAMGVIDYTEHYVNVWELEELDDNERAEMTRYIYYNTGYGGNALRWGHGKRTEYEENMRVPIRMAYLLRKELRKQRKMLAKPLLVPQELKLYTSVDQFMTGYYGMRKFMTTPFPFPLVQMARTFLFFYVFTVPFALLSDKSNPAAHCIVIMILTFGFMGLEYVAIELDNPFGDDDNDFDNLGMAQTAFEDTYLSILDVDGPQWTDRLRLKMNPRMNSKKPNGAAYGGYSGGEGAPLLV